MRSLLLFSVSLLFSLINATGQNYQTVYSNRIALFDNSYQNIRGIRIDSAKYQTDSILYPFTVIQEVDYDCYSPSVASWIGKKVIIKENGDNLFFNRNNDTITIKTTAKKGEKWTAFQIPDSLIVEATVIHHNKLNFLELQDSVKTISFHAYDKNMGPVDLPINSLNIQISKNYGFVKTLNFYLFPGLEVGYPYEELEEYNLIGLSNPVTGVQNLTWLDVFDFQAGDEIHVNSEQSNAFVNDYWKKTNKLIYKYLERTDYPDSIVYLYSLKQSTVINNNGSESTKYSFDTLKLTVQPDSLFDKLPGEPIIDDGVAYNFIMTNKTPLSKIDISSSDSYSSSDDTCWNFIIADDCFMNGEYIKGLGGPYYSCSNPFDLGGSERELVYYKKGDVTWGSPLVITGISEKETKLNITVFPNPAHGYVTINFGDYNTENCFIEIFSIQGKILKSVDLNSEKSGFSIENLNTGIYFYKLIDKKRILKTGKLIIE